ncbi:hypothetical protein [Lysobacter firmicutimachus]|uniref:Uncharacterized protein n=1 Tax=Lysobacter firmicutimachus TaxID=1792846 RepID=A0ABU8D3Z8_9GAMM
MRPVAPLHRDPRSLAIVYRLYELAYVGDLETSELQALDAEIYAGLMASYGEAPSDYRDNPMAA